MLIDAATDRSAAGRRFDVCVIGSGPAGITLARRLAAAGADVALMEAGDYYFSEESQALYRGENVGLDYFPLDTCRVRCFGGSSNHWGGWCRALDPVDFRAKPFNPMSGWPISELDLAPYADEADAILDLPPEPPLPPSELPPPGDLFTRVQFRFSPPTVFSDKYGDEIAASDRITLFLHANLVDLRLSDDLGGVSAAVFRGYDPGDPGFTVTAKAYALCTGGIENARLLLNFRSQVPEGIGNRSGMVGRCFAEHPHVAVADVLLRDPLGTREFFAATEALIFEREVLNFVVDIDARDPAPPPDLLKAVKRSLRCDLPFVDRLAERITGERALCADPALAAWWRDTPSPTALVRFNMEQAVNPESRVTLAGTRDVLGLQTTVLDWRIADLGFHTMRTGTMAFGAWLAREDVGRARIRDWLVAEPVDYPKIDSGDEVAGWHHMCTTRMAEDPRHGVVDADCRVHGIDNLYIGGSSVFATGGYSNPTYPIVQFALRLGDHIEARLPGWN